jgi:nitrogen regulatory protein PII
LQRIVQSKREILPVRLLVAKRDHDPHADVGFVAQHFEFELNAWVVQEHSGRFRMRAMHVSVNEFEIGVVSDALDEAIEIVCHDRQLEKILQALYASRHTGHRVDGRVFVLDVADALRLKTGKRGDQAIGPAAS